MLPLVDRLAAAGHRPSLAVPDHGTVLALLNNRAVPVLDAPFRPGGATTLHRIESWADIAIGSGYGTPTEARTAIAGWHALIRATGADLVVAEFSPGAMLAARVAGIPCVSVGMGWNLPPPVTPLPAIRFWAPADPAILAAAEARLLGAVNPALTALGGAPLATLAALFDPADACLCSFPELDHYPGRGPAEYFGAIYQLTEGAGPQWPAGPGPRCFAYVNARHPVRPALLAALGEVGCPTVLHLRGADPGVVDRLPGNAWLAPGPLRLDGILAERPLVVCQGPNLASAALAHGCPVLALPEHLEQTVLANRLVQQELGLALAPAATAEEAAAALRRLLTEPGPRAAAARFADRYAGYAPALAVEAVVEDCLARLE